MGSLMKPVITRLKFALVPPFGYGVIRSLHASMRWRVEGAEHVDGLLRQGKRMIITFWHAQQLMMPYAYRGSEAHVLISRHGDGELICRIIARFGLQAVRGSSTRGGTEALRELIRLGRSGVDLVITPDGPKGPRQVAKLGVIQLAKATGLPIVPLAFGCSKKNSLRAGTVSSCPIRSRKESFFGGSPSRCRATRRLRKWSACVRSWSSG
ncbi:MAG: lysophospholipid acyltransferase family protein [Nitrospiraceae bacterium]